MTEWRNGWFVGVAVVAHGVLFAVMPFVHHKEVVRQPPGIDIEVESMPGESTAAGATTAHGGSVGAKRVPLGHFRKETSTTNGAQPETTNPQTEVGTEPGQTEVTTLPAVIGPQSIGLDGPGSFRMEIARQVQQAPDEKTQLEDKARHAILDPLRAHDRRNGDLTSGPVAQELERTTRRLDGTPFEGRAIFSIDVDELGLVVNVGVSEASGDRSAWNEVARAVLNAFAQKRLHVPPGAKRVAMRIEISSKVTLPSGATHPMTVDSPAAEGLAHMAQGQFDRPGDTPAIVAGSFDLSDIGAHPQRVVGARVLSQETF